MKNCDHSDKVAKNMTADESEQLFGYMLSGTLNDDEIAEILLALKNKGETADEILGAIRAIKKTMHDAPCTMHEALDVCGTGGDGLHTLNISTAVALVVAGAGVKVAKHGNKAVSSSSGSSDVLTELGIKLDAPDLAKHNFAYFHAPLYYPALKKVAPARAKVGRTIFNLLGPLLNPVGAKRQLIGVYSANLLPTYAKVLRELGTEKAWVVHGTDGLDEISISGETQVAELDKGAIDTFIVTPEDAGLPRHSLESIKGGDAKHNAAALLRLLDGEKGAYRDIVLLNAAAALFVAGKAQNLVEGAQIAANAIDSGNAKQVLEQLKNA
jgi:anthranilate phosphoribosyltransferase